MCQNKLILHPANLSEVAEPNPVKINRVFFYVNFNRFWINTPHFIFVRNKCHACLHSIYTFLNLLEFLKISLEDCVECA